MSNAPSLHWLPPDEYWRQRLKAFITADGESGERWADAISLANCRLDFAMTNALDAAVRKIFGTSTSTGFDGPTARLALLTTSTGAHLHPALRVAALRRGIRLDVYENDYGRYWQELLDPASALGDFTPDVLLFAPDAHHLTGFGARNSATGDGDAVLTHLREGWRIARDRFGGHVIQQTLLDRFPPLLGNNEIRMPASRSAMVARLNAEIEAAASTGEIDMLALHHRQTVDGIDAWFNPALWYHAKQEIAPGAAPFYGDLAARLIAARRGRSFKCLALDLDNTLWGGIVGDDGVDGIQIGQGSAAGEAFAAFQEYAVNLSRRGIVLAICSKNDEANALEPFLIHPDMVMRRSDIACFMANWDDKPANLRRIAEQLNIGLDAILFVDDNPFERALVRRELPMVAVPEVGEEPAMFARTIADAGYFEAVALTQDDLARGQQYQQNEKRAALQAAVTDLDGYLRDLDMTLIWRRFDDIGLPRITQLVNKTNQFNLTTRRYTEDDIRAVMNDDGAIGLQFRLVDRFGDNGIIGVMIGRIEDDGGMRVDSWLMSCRVLGRGVERAIFDVFVSEAAKMGVSRIIGDYIMTNKNGMVRGLYAELGFAPAASGVAGADRAILQVSAHAPRASFIKVEEGQG